MPPQLSVDNLAYILRRCTKERNLLYSLCLHAYMCNNGLEAHTSLGNHLVSMLVEVGSMCNTQKVFDRLVYRNECSWNSLISCHIKCGQPRHALILYQKMQEESLHPNAYTFVALLKACAELKDVEIGCKIHAEIVRQGLFERDVFIGNTLVDMYAKCGLLAKAQEVFDKLPCRDVVSWNALIVGYAKHEHGEKALYCFEQMQLEGVSPNAITFSCSLKACGSIRDIDKGKEIHVEIATKGLLKTDLVLSNALVDMYAKCGLLAKAQEVFDQLPVRDVASWNALIAGYTKQERSKEALSCLEQMQVEGVFPDNITFICSLKACGSVGATDKGREIHAEIARKGLLERDLAVGNALVDMYAKCGWLAKAHEVFEKLPVRDIVSWTALIGGYAKHEHDEEALNCFEQMQCEGFFPDAVTFVCSLKACGSMGALDKGRQIHDEIVRNGLLERDLAVGNALVDMYANCDLLAKAREVLDKLPARDVITWNTLITGYVKHERSEEALNCFEQMQVEGVSPNTMSFVCSLKACGNIGATDKGIDIHAEISRRGFLERDSVVGNMLVDMYVKCDMLEKAQEVFDKLPVQNVVSWTALIAGYVKHDRGDEALNCFEKMQLKGVSPDAATFVCSLKACSIVGATDKGREIYAESARKGFLEKDPVVGNAVIDMYAKCGLLAKAQEVFDKLLVRDVISWNALIAGYAKHEHSEKALNCFERMQLEGVSPDSVTFVCSLKACSSIGAMHKGREIHTEITRKGLLDKDLVVGNALVDMYAKCGLLEKAQEVFDKLPVRDVVSWTALIAGYAEHGCGEEALHCLQRMQLEGVSPNAVTFVCSLKACGCIGAADKGREMHAEISRIGLLERDLVVGNALVDMYARCGLLAKAQEVFDQLPVRDVISWNTLIAGYVQLGESENVFHIFDRMRGEGEKPDLVTFVCILNACSFTGQVEKGQVYFEAMSKEYGINPTLEHHTCMVDLLGRTGHLDRAVVMIKKMPFHPDLVVWHTMLDACRKWGNVELGRKTFENALQLDEEDAAAYVCMCNI